MDNQPQIDNSFPNSDNVDNNDNKHEIVVRLDEQEPLNDPNCEHKFEQDDDEIGDYRAWTCIKCHRGVFLPKQITKVT